MKHLKAIIYSFFLVAISSCSFKPTPVEYFEGVVEHSFSQKFQMKDENGEPFTFSLGNSNQVVDKKIMKYYKNGNSFKTKNFIIDEKDFEYQIYTYLDNRIISKFYNNDTLFFSTPRAEALEKDFKVTSNKKRQKKIQNYWCDELSTTYTLYYSEAKKDSVIINEQYFYSDLFKIDHKKLENMKSAFAYDTYAILKSIPLNYHKTAISSKGWESTETMELIQIEKKPINDSLFLIDKNAPIKLLES